MVPKRGLRTACKRQKGPRMSRSGHVLIFEAPQPFQEPVLGILELHVGLHELSKMVILQGRGIQNQYFSVSHSLHHLKPNCVPSRPPRRLPNGPKTGSANCVQASKRSQDVKIRPSSHF